MSQDRIRRVGGELFQDPGPDGLIARGFLRGAGMSADMVQRGPVIGIANTWSELNPCHGGLRILAEQVKRGVIAAGGLPLEFPTISIAEAFVRPSSMYLRNLLAMDTEEMILASPIDAVVLLGGCDKTLPAQIMGAISAGTPALSLSAGPRPPSRRHGAPMTVDALWPLIDERRTGHLDDSEWTELEGDLSCGVGTCNVMGTAVSMAVMAEVLGMALPGTALLPAPSAQRAAAAHATGLRAVELARSGITPAQQVTEQALLDAFAVLCAVGGSTNVLIHLQAIAGRTGVVLDMDALRKIAAVTPLIADVKPSGAGLLEELQDDGGIPALMGRLSEIIDLDRLSADGRPWRDSIVAGGSSRLRTVDDPVGPPNALSLLRGSLAPDGAVLKRSAATPALCRHRGRAVVFDGLEDLRARIDDPNLEVEPDSVLVLRGVGPLGGPGMPEVGHLPIPAKLLARGVTDMVRLSDARMSGTAEGTVVLHVAPEAAAGGPLALVREGDEILLDADAGRLDLLVDPAELASRERPVERSQAKRGFERLFAEHVTQADRGCDFDFLQAVGS